MNQCHPSIRSDLLPIDPLDRRGVAQETVRIIVEPPAMPLRQPARLQLLHQQQRRLG
jgi:hypothetical protein